MEFLARIATPCLVVVAGAVGTVRAEPAKGLELRGCLVSPTADVQVPAREAGVLTMLEFERGDRVAAGEKLAQLDDDMAKAAKAIAELEEEASAEVAKDDSGIRYAKAAADVAKTEYEGAIAINEDVPDTFSVWDIRRLKLTSRRSEVQIEKDELDHRVAGVSQRIKQAALDQAELQLKRRQILSPVDGVVVEIYKEKGEWVAPGDAVVRVVGIEKLRVEGFVSADKYAPKEIMGKPVTVRVKPVRDHVEICESKISFVSPVVEASGEYRVWAEITNRLEGPFWAARPGLDAEMTIRLDGE